MSNFTTIEVDFEVFQKIQMERKSFSDSDNDALRRLLDLPSITEPRPSGDSQEVSEGGIHLRYNVSLPQGTRLRMKYRGELHYGDVRGGRIWVNEKPFNGPSPAAVEITSGNVNGWNYWEVLFPGSTNWVKIMSLRN